MVFTPSVGRLRGVWQTGNRPLEPPKVRLTLEGCGRFDPGVHDIEVENTPRYVKDFQDLAQSIRTGKPLDFGYDHDLVVQETVLRASGMW